MKPLFYLLFILISLGSCIQTASKNEDTTFYNTHEDKFTFLVFDKAKVDTFLSKFEPLKYSNAALKQELILLSKIKLDTSSTAHINSFIKNTTSPDSSDYKLAIDVINATYNKDGEEYFQGSLNYLFFYNCLPTEFKIKWTQTWLGDFQFNSHFFEILRKKSEIIDKIIYGEISQHDSQLLPIFEGFIFNEINSEQAQQIKQLIENDKSFDDPRFKTDRDNFIYFLDKTSKNEWRLILKDCN